MNNSWWNALTSSSKLLKNLN